MLARNSLLARLAASAATLARTKSRSALLPFLFVFDVLQGERQVGGQLVEQVDFLVVEGSGTVRVNGNGAKQPAIVDHRRSRHRTIAWANAGSRHGAKPGSVAVSWHTQVCRSRRAVPMGPRPVSLSSQVMVTASR